MTAIRTGWNRKRLRPQLAVVIGVSICFLCTAAYTSTLIVQRQRSLNGISRYNLTWSATQSVTELLRLEQAIALHMTGDARADKDEVEIRLEIVANRADVMRHGDMDDLVHHAPELSATVSALGAAIETAKPLVNGIDGPGNARKLLDLLAPLNMRMEHLAAKAHAFSGDNVAQDEGELGRLHWIFSGLLLALIVCGIGLLALLLRNSGVLRRAHEELRTLTDEFRYAAHHDTITGLANRVLFQAESDRAIVDSARADEVFAVLQVDLDHFKEVNDTLGHSAGDSLLKEVGARLLSCTRPTDVVSRLGGDEFAILVKPYNDASHVAQLAERLLEAVSSPYAIDGQCVLVGASIGVALYPDNGRYSNELLRSADIALYRAKRDGRATFRFFDVMMDAEMQNRRAIAVDLRGALEHGEFEVFFQPLVELATGRLIGAEALLRWNSAARGMVPPSDFIPVMEESGLIRALGAWVLEQACCEARNWPEDVKVAVNLSPKQFNSGELVQDVSQVLERSGLRPNRLELEITESVLLQDCASVLDILHDLRALGVGIALDDFGTGYSSLSYLRVFPFHKIKIDQCFVRDLTRDGNSLHIIRAIAALACNLGMTTTAEGIETQEQLSRVRAAGCIEGQGYLFERPVPAKDLRELINRRAPFLQPDAAAMELTDN